MTKGEIVGRLIVVIDVNPSHGFWTARLIKVFGHEGKCTCIYNTHEWIVYIMLFPVVCGTSHGLLSPNIGSLPLNWGILD
jgi:hypothetical protein